MSDPLGKGPVTVELNHTLAELLARLCVELSSDGSAEDPTGVMSRALGLLDMVQRTKRTGGRLCFINERGDIGEVAV